MAVLSSASLAAAVMMTRPEVSALMAPLCSIRPPSLPRFTRTASNLSPLKSRSTDCPATSAVAPAVVETLPLLTTSAATSATLEPLMLPRLTTDAPDAPANATWPAMKSLLVMPSVVATRCPTSTCALPPNRMPLGLVRNTPPLATSCPRMLDCWLPVTRLSTTLPLPGCTN